MIANRTVSDPVLRDEVAEIDLRDKNRLACCEDGTESRRSREALT